MKRINPTKTKQGKDPRLKNSEVKNRGYRPQGNETMVAIAEGDDIDSCLLLDQALELAGFWKLAVHNNCAASGGRAVILVDIHAFELALPVITRIELVEHLIDALAKYGWSDIAIASSPDSSITWAENRDISVLADLVGYQYETVNGTCYDVLDLSENLVNGDFPNGSVLAGSIHDRQIFQLSHVFWFHRPYNRLPVTV